MQFMVMCSSKKTWNMDEKKVSIAVWLPGLSARSLAWSQLFSCCGDVLGRPPLFSPVDSNHPYETGHLGMCQNPVPLVNIKIAGKWMFIPLKMVLIGIDP